MIKYEFMGAHGKGSEGSEKRGRGCENKKGVRKKRGAPHPPFLKRGVHAAQATPLYTLLLPFFFQGLGKISFKFYLYNFRRRFPNRCGVKFILAPQVNFLVTHIFFVFLCGALEI